MPGVLVVVVTGTNKMPKDKAYKMAAQIAEFWSRRGAIVKTWVEKEPWTDASKTSNYCVRSDLVNGLPVRCPADTLARLTREVATW
jgi:hypothetical protein